MKCVVKLKSVLVVVTCLRNFNYIVSYGLFPWIVISSFLMFLPGRLGTIKHDSGGAYFVKTCTERPFE
jgi:hypothetical protein